MAKEQQTTPAEAVDSVDAAQAQVKEIEVRRQKLAALRERGIDPFGAAFAARSKRWNSFRMTKRSKPCRLPAA